MRSRACLMFAVLALAACGDNGDDNRPIDARTDAAVVDAGPDAPDIDAADIDGATIDTAMIDAAMVDATDGAVIDTAVIDTPDIDTPPPTDASTVGQIQTAHDTADGTGLTLPIEGATITYLKPALGNDPAGFTVQALQTGPALFIAVDPATLNPPPARGDVVSFTITAMGTAFSMRQATAITGYTRLATGAPLAPLTQDLSAATDLVTAVATYESELANGTGTLTGTFGASGSMFEKIQFATAGIPTDINLKLRVPTTLRDALDLAGGCQIAVAGTPIVRNGVEAQFSAFAAGEMTITGCPAPTVVGAVATSPTTVVVTFSRRIDMATVIAGGSQFTFDNGLTASAATVNARTVTLTTSAQTGGTTYLLTVASTVHDLQGAALGSPSTASFTGYLVPAVLRINEFNANIASGCDLIELRVISGGSTTNFRLTERVGGTGELNMTLPSVTVATNDIIVVHLASGSATCNPGGAVSETTSITQQPVATFTRNYDTAWDFWDTDTGLTATDNVFTLFAPGGAIADVVFSASATTGTAAAATETAAETARAADQWRLNDGSLPALGFYVDDMFRANSAQDLDGTGTAASGTSVQRLDDTDDNNTADWNSATVTVQNNTFGLRNAGQNAL